MFAHRPETCFPNQFNLTLINLVSCSACSAYLPQCYCLNVAVLDYRGEFKELLASPVSQLGCTAVCLCARLCNEGPCM